MFILNKNNKYIFGGFMLNRRMFIVLPLVGAGLLSACAGSTTDTLAKNTQEADSAVKPPQGTQTIDGVDYTMTEQFLSLGSEDAAHTIRLFEDMQCPYCKELMLGIHEDLVAKVKSGAVKLEIVPVNYLGVRSTNGWSENAANFLAVVSVSQPDKFMEVQETLFEHQPEERSTEVIPSSTLRNYVKDVIELSDTEIKDIDDGKYVDWINKVVTPFAASNDVKTIPTVVVDGTVLEDYTTIKEQLKTF